MAGSEKKFCITKATPDDWEAAMELCWRTFLKFEAPVYSQEGIDNFLKFISGAELHKMFLIDEYKMYVAREEGSDEIIGVTSVRNRNHVSLLFVDERYHRMGIGRALLKRLQRQPEGDIKLTVNAAPYAVEFYHKLGFIDSDSMQESDGIKYTPMTCLSAINSRY